jgi:hypothetical protein
VRIFIARTIHLRADLAPARTRCTSWCGNHRYVDGRFTAGNLADKAYARNVIGRPAGSFMRGVSSRKQASRRLVSEAISLRRLRFPVETLIAPGGTGIRPVAPYRSSGVS